MARDKPLVLLGWLSLLALEDLPEFCDLSGVAAEHLIQSLLYRLRECREEMSDRVGENVKVGALFSISNCTFSSTERLILQFCFSTCSVS